MKKVFLAVGFAVVVSLISVIGIVAFDIIPQTEAGFWNFKVDSDHLYLDDKQYVDYAKEVDYDYEKYPELETQQGLVWYTLNEVTNKISEAPADSELGASYVDPSKPTVVFIHGMESQGYRNRNTYALPQVLEPKSALGLTDLSNTSTVFAPYVWMKKGYNVGMFHWERFSSGPMGSMLELPIGNEERIWANNGSTKTRFVDSEGNMHYDATNYTVGEHFAAEYIRAMNLLPDTMGDNEIRFVAHSMGGQVTAAGLFLLTELAHPDVKQIDAKKLPNRYALIDTYFSTIVKLPNGGEIVMSPEKINIRWSGKPLPKNALKQTIFDCLKVFKHHGIVTEYITYRSSFLRASLDKTDVQTLLECGVFIDADIDWSEQYERDPKLAGSGALWEFFHAHVGMLYLYCGSISTDFSADVTEDSETAYAPTAATSTEDLKQLIGKCYLQTDGGKTLTAADDKYIQVSIEDLYSTLSSGG